MKKSFAARSAAIVAAVLVLMLSAAVVSFAEDAVSFNLRIEGINETIFAGDVTVPATAGGANLQAALIYFDTNNESVTFTGAESAYITDINGDSAGTYGGWDGWMFRINGIAPSTGIDGCTVVSGDEVVIYYTDEYGLGMQFPVMDTTKAGTIKFTSTDVTYDENYNPTETVNPVADMTVVLTDKDGKTETFTTDANGEINYAAKGLSGDVTVTVSKAHANGCPAVLRIAPASVTLVSIPDTQDSNVLFLTAASAVIAILLIVSVKRKNTI